MNWRFVPFAVGLLLIIPLMSANVEAQEGPVYKGKNYDLQFLGLNELGQNKHKWTAQPERVLSGWYWQDYIYSNEPEYVRYESASISFEYYKTTCDFKVYTPGIIGSSEPVFASVNSVVKTALNGTDVWDDIEMEGCATTVQETNTGLMINSTAEGDGVEHVKIFVLDYDAGLEWTHEITNNNSTYTNQKFGVTDTCEGCNILEVEGVSYSNNELTKSQVIQQTNSSKNIKIKDYRFDSKNEQHNYLWVIKQQGNKTIFDYTDAKGPIGIGQKLIIDPTFSSSSPTTDGQLEDQGNNGSCDGNTIFKTTADMDSYTRRSSSAHDCYIAFMEYDVSSIPDGAQVTDSNITYEVNAVSSPYNCDWVALDDQPSTASDSVLFSAIISDTVVVDNDSTCTTTGAGKNEDLSTAFDSYVEGQLTSDWVGIGIKPETLTQDATDHQVSFTQSMTLEIEYTTGPPTPNAPVPLNATDIEDTELTLFWDQDTWEMKTGNLTGHQINYTTPWGDPLTILVNDTGSTAETYDVSGLTQLTNYSFRVSPHTEGPVNASGFILNVTTLEDFTLANFTPGSFDIDATNTAVPDITFERINVNDTTLRLNVTFSNTLDNMKCDFDYQFAQTNNTYSNLDSIVLDENYNETSFLFVDVDNEIIDVYCWDDSNANGTYIITQSDIPLVSQIKDWQSGEFGTEGNFGAIDLVVLVALILAMIGFNRINESVGAIFGIMFIGALAYFEIITLPTIIFGALSVVIMLVVASTRKKS